MDHDQKHRRDKGLRIKTTGATVFLGLALACGAGFGYFMEAGSTRLALAGSRSKQQAQTYHCPMHPNYTSDKPGNCPICGMNLVPIEEEADTKHEEDQAETAVPGRASIRISPKKRQALGVETVRVSRGPFIKTIRTVGRVAYAEPMISEVYAKFEGWAEKLYVNKTGDWVERGRPLFSVYSPELVATQQEFLLALNLQKSQGIGADALLKAARRRLAFFDIDLDQTRHLETTGQTSKTLLLRAPRSGFVIQKNVFEGKKISRGESLYTIADISTVWVLADAYESDLPFVSLGQQAKISLSSYPGATFRGRVAYIYPYLEANTRTNKVRIEVKNAESKLKPDMYANIELAADMGDQLIVPKSAVLDSGTRKVAFLDMGKGYFEPRELKTGLENETSYAVLYGLEENDRIVDKAAFMVDSESSLKAGLGQMGAPSEHAGHTGH